MNDWVTLAKVTFFWSKAPDELQRDAPVLDKPPPVFIRVAPYESGKKEIQIATKPWIVAFMPLPHCRDLSAWGYV